jgi:3-hydroxyisobutyrate dehydrogenase-like beta-hydroxyacid dehydrogenase
MVLSNPHSATETIMAPVVAVIAPGAMGAAVGKRLADHGVKVLTSLNGRSRSTVARASAAAMISASDEEIAAADFILSIVPPGDALSLAQRLVPALAASNGKPVYVDCNAINPATVERVAAAIAPTGCPFVDAGIIGPPPKATPKGGEEEPGPRVYASGAAAPHFATLREYGLDLRVLEGALSAASALKMSYAGITKGTQAIGAAMMLAATRAGSAEALFKELEFSQKEMLAWLKQQLAVMPPKAYRWVAEMHEIAGFVGDDPTAHELYEGAAHFYERIAEDFAADKKYVAALMGFLAKDSAGS